MKKWYQENYFSHRNWIMENLKNLKLSGNQLMILLMIDYDNEFRIPITIETLSQQTNLKTEQIDKIVMDLCQKEYLQIVSRNRKIVYDISGIFEEKPKIGLPDDLFATFENEFGRPLSQPETVMLAEWINKYNKKEVIKALREALKLNKLSFNYIDRILVNSNNGK
ncbi:MAG: DnaD domain protein [Erysipelotrichaceae bacterium]|nr:DnaD domain protein [Erysipelotrichaceae bacterium]